MNLSRRASDSEKGFITLVSENSRKTYEIDGYALIGRDPHCTICLTDGFTSLRHARIERAGPGFSIRDLRSRNGTFVNGNRVIEAHLHDHDRIRIGMTEFLFSFEREQAVHSLFVSSKNALWNDQLSRLPAMAASPHPVLILGPSGTGKEMLASLVHRYSSRSQGPFLSVNCSALTETLAESELFGHTKGSFTGATMDRKGAFESARDGTLFLDEIGDLPMSIQPKLLRALENSEIKPVGSDKPVAIDVRIVAATNQNLKARVQQGLFREDLYFRLHVLQLQPPALRDRMEDFDDLMKFFAGNQPLHFDVSAQSVLQNYSWPGNIRELKNAVMRASALFPGTTITSSHVTQLIDGSTNTLEKMIETAHLASPLVPVRQNILDIERKIIVDRLQFFAGNQRRAAAALGIPKSTLHDRIKKYSIDIGKMKRPANGETGNEPLPSGS
jgi:DNA-binding NtrC family response regulator